MTPNIGCEACQYSLDGEQEDRPGETAQMKILAAAWNRRATPPEVTALVDASTALRDHIARWHDGGPPAGPDESKALFEALDDALAKLEAAQ